MCLCDNLWARKSNFRWGLSIVVLCVKTTLAHPLSWLRFMCLNHSQISVKIIKMIRNANQTSEGLDAWKENPKEWGVAHCFWTTLKWITSKLPLSSLEGAEQPFPPAWEQAIPPPSDKSCVCAKIRKDLAQTHSLIVCVKMTEQGTKPFFLGVYKYAGVMKQDKAAVILGTTQQHTPS